MKKNLYILYAASQPSLILARISAKSEQAAKAIASRTYQQTWDVEFILALAESDEHGSINEGPPVARREYGKRWIDA